MEVLEENESLGTIECASCGATLSPGASARVFCPDCGCDHAFCAQCAVDAVEVLAA
jgi:predicted RNA-binding Zn-ribbon protein involved in translation (DUF1610 family)